MFTFLQRFASLVVVGLIAACAQFPTRTDVQPPADTGDTTADVVYHSLAAEVSAHRGLLDDAFRHYIWIARNTRDAAAAEKAARIGLHLNKNGDTLYAAALWAELAPADIGAHEVSAAVFLREGRTDEAYEALVAVGDLAVQQGKRGFVESAGVVTASESREAGLEVMGRLARANANNAEARYAHALVLLAFGDVSGAEREVRAALVLRSDEELAWVLLSRIEVQKGRPAVGGEVLQEAVRRNPGSRLLRVSYARWLVEARQYDKAYAQFERLLQNAPDDPDILFSLGALATDLERWGEARGYWQRLLQLGERVDEAHYFLAQVEEAAGNLDEALALYASVDDGPLRVEAAVRRAEILAARGDIDAARRLLGEQRVLFPDRAIALYLIEAQILIENDRPAEAASVYDVALTAFPGNIDLLYARAMHAASEQRLEVLERDLRSILAADPDHADALNALGYTLADQTNRYEEAFELISRALELKPENAAVLDSMGWVQYRLGNLEAALNYLRRAAARDDDSEIAAHLGEVLWVTGRRDEAIQVFRDALDRDPESLHLRETLDRLRLSP